MRKVEFFRHSLTEEDMARFRRIYLFSCIYLAIPPYQ